MRLTKIFLSLLFACALQNQALAQNTATPKQVAANGFADIVEELLPSVVNISAVQEVQTNSASIDQNLLNELPKIPLFDDFKNQLENQLKNSGGQRKKISSIGSGFIISKDGFIVTNNHVISDADEINVSLNDGSKYKAKVVGVDKKTDIALLKVNSNKDLKPAKFGDSNKARIGDWVIVVGNPYGLGASVTVGIVSARGRTLNGNQADDFIQTDAAINKGNSGGPLFNVKGEVIGISTAIFSPSGGNVGIGFATPAAAVMQVTKELRDQGEVTRGWIGVSVQDVTEEMAQSMKMEKTRGAFVVELAADGPAQKAGILPTDIITKIDNNEVTEMKVLPKIISAYPIGKNAKITLLRQGKTRVINVKVAKMPSDEKKPELRTVEKRQILKTAPNQQLLGLGLIEISASIKQNQNKSVVEGLLISDVAAKSEAAEKGIAANDVIVSVNQKPVKTIEDFKKIIDEVAESTKKVFLFVKRGDSNYAVVLNTK
jgi:serine protease Do